MWYVIQVKTTHEEDIIAKCKDRVLLPEEDAFFFRVRWEKKRGGEWETVEKPAFPGYVFLDIEDTDGIRIRLREIKEMTRLLSTGEDFVPVYPEEKAFLLSISENHLINKSFGCHQGNTVVITEGSLKGCEGRIAWINRHKRECGVNFLFFGEVRTIKLPLEIVTKDI